MLSGPFGSSGEHGNSSSLGPMQQLRNEREEWDIRCQLSETITSKQEIGTSLETNIWGKKNIFIYVVCKVSWGPGLFRRAEADG